MDIAATEKCVLQERSALQQPGSASNPSYLSEHTVILAQYNSMLEQMVGQVLKDLEVKESKLFKEYKQSMSVSAAEKKIKYDLMEEKAEATRLKSLYTSSWRLISVFQSRVKHLIQEAQNQI